MAEAAGSAPVQVSTTGALFAWDPTTRLVTVRFRSTNETSMVDREEAARKLRSWTGQGSYRVVVHCEGEGTMTPGVLAFWGGFFRLARAPVHIATIGFPPAREAQMREWASRFGFSLTSFGTERDAAAWLATPPTST